MHKPTLKKFKIGTLEELIEIVSKNRRDFKSTSSSAFNSLHGFYRQIKNSKLIEDKYVLVFFLNYVTDKKISIDARYIDITQLTEEQKNELELIKV